MARDMEEVSTLSRGREGVIVRRRRPLSPAPPIREASRLVPGQVRCMGRTPQTTPLASCQQGERAQVFLPPSPAHPDSRGSHHAPRRDELGKRARRLDGLGGSKRRAWKAARRPVVAAKREHAAPPLPPSPPTRRITDATQPAAHDKPAPQVSFARRGAGGVLWYPALPVRLSVQGSFILDSTLCLLSLRFRTTNGFMARRGQA